MDAVAPQSPSLPFPPSPSSPPKKLVSSLKTYAKDELRTAPNKAQRVIFRHPLESGTSLKALEVERPESGIEISQSPQPENPLEDTGLLPETPALNAAIPIQTTKAAKAEPTIQYIEAPGPIYKPFTNDDSSAADRDVRLIYVGKEQEQIQVHTNELIRRARFFDELFNKDSKKHIQALSSLSKEGIEALKVLLNWVNDGSLPLLKQLEPEQWTWKPTHVYALADVMDLPELMDAVMDTLRAAYATENQIPSLSAILQGYRKTRKGSKMRKYMSQSLYYILVAAGPHEKGYGTTQIRNALKDNDYLAHDVLSLVRSQAGNPVSNPSIGYSCEYHAHYPDLYCGYHPKPLLGSREVTHGSISTEAHNSPCPTIDQHVDVPIHQPGCNCQTRTVDAETVDAEKREIVLPKCQRGVGILRNW